ncbi:MAG: phage head-tail connector protein [Candidatus Marinimicrobia bacterium]|nr:phage head-tail connector protein [Candidatus Neomarinimicrobiota bacterium]
MQYHFALERTSDPSVEPLSTSEAKDHLRVTGSADDTYIASLIKVARFVFERDTGRALITQTWEQTMDRWPPDSEILLAVNPVQSISSITYDDTDGNNQTVTAADYRVDTKSLPAMIVPSYGNSWPSARTQSNSIKVTFVAGYGDAATDLDEDSIAAVRLLVGHYYLTREPIGTIATKLPQTFDWIVDKFKVRDF